MLKKHLLSNLEQLLKLLPAERLQQRYAKFRAYGHYMEKPAATA